MGDGVHDDTEAIARAHAAANAQGRPVQAKAVATYYLSGKTHPINIQTDTDFGTASFVIDDREVENNKTPVFRVTSTLPPTTDVDLPPLKAGATILPNPTGVPCLVLLEDDQTLRYIRKGANQNPGTPQKDVLRIDATGSIDERTPLLWDFDRFSSVTYLPIDPTPLTLQGGRFTTVANQEPSTYNYYDRNLQILRSTVIVDGMEHRVTGEGETGAPYNGFIKVNRAADVHIRNTTLTGRKRYETIGNAGTPVMMGSYDILVNHSTNVSLNNVHQFNDIHDNTSWGLFSSNFCKNLIFDSCTVSRFDAHMGVTHATILNSTMGHMNIKVIGSGRLLVENTTVTSKHMIDFRPDYGSTWNGSMMIRDCTFRPTSTQENDVHLFYGNNDGQHDFGYPCTLPMDIEINGLNIDLSQVKDGKHLYLFADFEGGPMTQGSAPFPITPPERITLERINTSNGLKLHISPNQEMFAETEVERGL